MAIDKSGKYWKGSTFADLDEYIRAYTEEGYPAQVIRQSVCTCGAAAFQLEADRDEGCARRICSKCSQAAFIGDSSEYWDEANPRKCICPCRNRTFEVGVGFSLRADGEVNWITVGERCLKCGVLSSFVDWKIGYAPTEHLLAQV
jgi:hypothetical protein